VKQYFTIKNSSYNSKEARNICRMDLQFGKNGETKITLDPIVKMKYTLFIILCQHKNYFSTIILFLPCPPLNHHHQQRQVPQLCFSTYFVPIQPRRRQTKKFGMGRRQTKKLGMAVIPQSINL